LSVAAPVGPIGVLVIHRTLARGRSAGLFTGFGVATADAIYASFAAFGITLLSNLLISLASPVRLIGGLFLLYLGIKTMISKPAEKAAASNGETDNPKTGARLSDYFSALALTITNPMTIVMFAGIFAGVGFADASVTDSSCAPFIVAGVFAGSVLWWLILSGTTGVLRSRFTPRVMLWINRASGAIIIAFAVVSLAGLSTG
jgi:threonine/homoserine/homoserine lactone efflux protein